ncbi:hypothetical protein GCM10027422_06960 [Hymenobacter arcticus]
MALGARGQTPLVTENFATDGEGVRYTSNSATIASQPFLDPGDGTTKTGFNNLHYFIRSDFNPPRYPNTAAGGIVFGTSTNPLTIYDPGTTTPAATGFWACEGVRGAGGISVMPRTDPGNVTLNAVTVTNYTGLQVQVKLADARFASAVADADDKIRIQYSMDGGAWTTVGMFMGGGSMLWTSADPGTETQYPSTDARYRTLTRAFQACTYNIGTIGNSLRVRVEVDQFGGTEETAFDDLAVLGTVSTVTPPSLTNINPGNTDVTYTEAQPSPVQITSSITASYATNLTGATVQFSTGFRTGQDRLNFTNQSSISGSYNTGTGVLTLTGSAPPAAYQAALRSITYSNSSTTNATGGRRTVRFSVTDGSNTSAAQTRDVVVTAILAGPAAMPYTEDFTPDGEGTRYATNTFNVPSTGGGGLGWFRTNVNPMPDYTTATFSNISNGYYWYGEGTKNVSNPDPALIGFLETQTIDATNYRNLHYQVRLAQGLAGQWEADDYVKFYYRVGTGSWVLFGAFYGNGSSRDLQRDTDLDGLADGTVLTNTLTNIDFTLPPALGGIIDFRTVHSSNGAEEMAMDLIQVTGTQVFSPTVTTAAASSITPTSAVLGGNVTDGGGDAVTERGVVYVAGTGTPTTSNTKDANGSGTGSFSRTVSGLTASTQYTVRAYAINSVGTSYGANVTFTTLTTVTSIVPAAANPTNASSVTYTVTFAASVTGLTTANFTTVPSAGITGSSVTSVSGSGTTYTVTVSTGSGSGTLGLTLANDTNLTPGIFNKPFTGTPLYTIDKTAPTVTISSSTGASGSTSSAATFAYTVTFSESVTGFVAGDVTVSNGTISGFSGSGTTYTFNVTPAANGAVTVNVPANVAQDAASNGNTAASQYSIAYAQLVTAAPVITSPANNTLTNQDVTISGTAPANSAVTVYVSQNGTAFQEIDTYTATAGGTFTATALSLPSSTYQTYAIAQSPGADVSANSNRVNFIVDQTRPTVAISSTAGASGGNTTTSPIPFTVTFSEPVTGFVAGDVTVSNNASVGTVSGSGTTYTFNVTPTTAGLVTVNVPANVAQDAASNGNTAASPYSITYSQLVTAAPVVLTPANGFVNTNRPTYSGTAVAGSTITVFVNNSVIGTATADGTGNWTFAQPAPLVNAAYTVYATAQTSGSAASAKSNTNTFVVDTISPTVTISSSTAPSGSTSSSSPLAYTVTFSEGVTGFVAGDVTVTNGAISSFTAASSSSYTFTVTPAANGVVTVNVPVNVAQDAAGNGNNAASPYSITYSQLVTAAPVITSPTDNQLFNTTTPTYQGTAVANSTITVFVDGTAIGTTTAVGGNFSLTQPTALAQGSHTVRATAQASGAAVSAASTTVNFTIDSVSPTVVLGSTATSPTATLPIPVRVTFSESVTGFGANGVTVTNGTLTGFSGSGSLYTFNVTPLAPGTVTVNIAANVTQDAAGNGNTAATTFSITYTPAVTATTWTGAVSSDWFTAGNWTAGVPTAMVDATIPAAAPRYPLISAGTANTKNLSINSGASNSQTGGTLIVNGDLTNNGTFSASGGTVSLGATARPNGPNILGSSSSRFWNLTVQTNGVLLSTSAGASVQRVLTLVGNLTTNGNAFTLLSGSTGDALVVNNGGVVAGTATVQRYIDPSVNPGLGARHYSAPVSNTTVADLTTGGFTPVLNPAFNTADKPAQVRPFPMVFGYDQSRLTLVNTLPTFDKGFFSPSALSDPLLVGRGYVVNLASTELVDFVGTLNNGDVTTTMASNRATYANDGGWQLVGNPYPAPLDYGTVLAADRAGLDGSFYVYSSTSQYQGRYRAYVRGVGDNPVVPSGQGFFVRVSSGQLTGSLTLHNTNRLVTPDATTFQRTAAETRPLVQLTLQGAGNTADDAYVYFENGATNGLDAQYDAVKLPNTTGLNLSTSITGQQLAIDGRAELGKAQQVVPLAVGVPTVGTYTFTTAQLLNLANVPVYLRDLQLGTITDLRLTPSYQFTVTNAAALITGRFELVFSPQQALATVPAALAQQVALYPNPAQKAAFVELPSSLGRQAVTATLVDALGRQVRTVQLPAQGSVAHPLDLSELATGVYALRLSTSAGVVVKKLVVE